MLDIARLYLDKARVVRTTHRRYTKIATSGDSEKFGKGSGAEIEYFEKTCNLEARIDSRIDKAFQRLANLKEFKRFEASKAAAKQLTASPPIAPELSSSESNASAGNAETAESGNPTGEAQPEGDTK